MCFTIKQKGYKMNTYQKGLNEYTKRNALNSPFAKRHKMKKHNESHIQYIARTTNKTQQEIFGLFLDELNKQDNEFTAIVEMYKAVINHMAGYAFFGYVNMEIAEKFAAKVNAEI